MLIVDERIKLRRPEPQDIENMYQYRNAPDTVALLGQFSRGFARIDILDWIENQQKNTEDIVWVIVNSHNQCIGHCGLYRINSRNRVAEVDVCIGQTDFRGTGLGTKIISHIIAYAFQQMNLRKIKAQVVSTNSTALGMLGKVGFQTEGVLKEARYVNRQYLDLHMLSVFKSGWKQGDEQCPQE